MTVEQAIAELRSDIALYETEICKSGDGSPDGDLMEALEMAIAALEHENKWISVDDALPENDDHVLCCTQNAKGNYNIVIGYYMDSVWRCGMNSNVRYWMPLPMPPEVTK